MSDDKPQKTSNLQDIIKETEIVTKDKEGKETTEIREEIDTDKLEAYLVDLDNDIKKIQTYLSRETTATGIAIGDADWDTIVYTEKTSDEDKVRINIAGTELFVFDASGMAVAATQPAGVADTLVKESIVKSWINFTGSVLAINDSYNVISVTDNGEGDYTITWNVDFATANYCPMAMAERLDVGVQDAQADVCIKEILAGSLRVVCHDNTIQSADYATICVGAVGDQ